MQGSYNDAVKGQVAIGFDEAQLAAMRDRVARLDESKAADLAGSLERLRSQIYDARHSGYMGQQTPDVLLPEWMRQIEELEKAAKAARDKRIEAGDADADDRSGFFGRSKFSTEDVTKRFDRLTPDERKLIVVSGAIEGNQRKYGQGWNSLRLVLRVKDPAERNALLREVFAVVARRDDDANAPMELLAFLEQAADEAGVPRSELNTIVSNTQVSTLDAGPVDAAKQWRGQLRKKGIAAADAWAVKRLKEVATIPTRYPYGSGEGMEALGQGQTVTQLRADKITDFLQGVTATAGPAGLEGIVAKALADDPQLLRKLGDILAKDTPRAALARQLLAPTKYRLP